MKAKILLQLDPDPQPSVVDAVVAIDAGAEQLLRHGGVLPAQVRDLVHGAMFTRGPQDLHHTAIFIGGANVAAGEELLAQVKACFFGPLRVSVLFDANGANTTAAAAVLATARHLPLAGKTVVVLAGTGPVGQRVGRLALRQGAQVRLASRDLQRAQAAAQRIGEQVGSDQIVGVATSDAQSLIAALAGAEVVVAAGAAGIELLPQEVRRQASSLRVAVDLNAVPPLGIAGVEVMDKGQERDGVICYGALGVGGLKMKIHRAAIAQLFTANNLVLDAEEVFALGQSLA